MALSAPDLLYVRENSGDDLADDAGHYEVTTDTINAIYDDTNTGNSDLDRTVFYVIKRRLGKAARLVAESNPLTGLSFSNQQKFQNLKDLLALWSGFTGISLEPAGGTLSVGTLSLGIDQPCPDGFPNCRDDDF